MRDTRSRSTSRGWASPDLADQQVEGPQKADRGPCVALLPGLPFLVYMRLNPVEDGWGRDLAQPGGERGFDDAPGEEDVARLVDRGLRDEGPAMRDQRDEAVAFEGGQRMPDAGATRREDLGQLLLLEAGAGSQLPPGNRHPSRLQISACGDLAAGPTSYIFDILLSLRDFPDCRRLNIEPALATRREVMEPTRVRFFLREGVKVCEGQDLDAEDVAVSLMRMVNEKPPVKGNLPGLKAAEGVDPLTVDLILDGL